MKATLIEHIGDQPNDGPPIYRIGWLVRGNSDGSPKNIAVTMTLSRKNSMEKLGGQHIALVTEPTLTWEEAKAFDIYASDLLAGFQRNERQLLAVLFPHMPEEELSELACAIGGNTERTANRTDMHAHVSVAPAAVWASGKARRMVDDARNPKLIGEDAVAAYLRQAAEESRPTGWQPSDGIVNEK